MNASIRTSSRPTFVQIAVAIAGAVYLFTGVFLMFAPAWFFDTFGKFPPFNRHYMGDLGSFLLPLGIGLLVAAGEPRRYRGLIGVAAVGSLIHAGNHLYADLTAGQIPPYFLQTTLPLLVLASLLIVAWIGLRRASA
ncbi:MAG TPA: hypothetical protein VJG32_12340 [Anaerolineae bacterium]|nr:hypothetical protein [Anaerolineae bacterium]